MMTREVTFKNGGETFTATMIHANESGQTRTCNQGEECADVPVSDWVEFEDQPGHMVIACLSCFFLGAIFDRVVVGKAS